MVFGCNWPNCSKQFGGQKQYKEHLMREHLGEYQKEEDLNGNGTSQQMVVSKMDKKQILLPVETWVDILLCISRIELAKTVSLTNWLFSAISRPRIDEENKRIVPPLIFFNDKNGITILQHMSAAGTEIPIAQVAPPINILGDQSIDKAISSMIWAKILCKYGPIKGTRICIKNLNDQILEFIGLIKPILGTNIILDMGTGWYNKTDTLPNCVSQLCNMIKGNVLKLITSPGFCNLLNIEFLKTIQFLHIMGPAEDDKVEQHILEWIHSPMDGNKPHYILMHIKNINQLAEFYKKHFLESTVPVSFIFQFETMLGEPPTPFSIENHRTGEQLTLGWYYDDDVDEGRGKFMFCRFPIGDDQGWRQLMLKVYKVVDVNEYQTTLAIPL